MPDVVAMSGSLRTGSYNTALLRHAGGLAPTGCRVSIESISEVPLYDADRQAAEGLPPRVMALKGRIAAAEGLLLSTPEYNGSFPGVLKNAMDWLSRPPSDIDRVFGGLPVGLMGATPGRGGTVLAQSAWLPVLRSLGTRVWSQGVLRVSRAHRVLDEDEAPAKEELSERIRAYMEGFVNFLADVQREGTASPASGAG